MPILESTYKPPFWAKTSFVSTVYSGMFRKVKGVEQTRERITLPDTDFIDLDWSYAKEKSNKVIILLHGLEGHAQRPYITGTAKLFNDNGIDAVGVNYRGCSGEPNLLYRSYHSGATEDLDAVVKHVLTKNQYDDIYIKGISLGANMALKHGFKDALDYYEKASCLQFLPNIKVPSLIINALNDSFLSSECYSVKEAKHNSNLFLEMPKYGGHVGFIDKRNIYYNEQRALDFISEL